MYGLYLLIILNRIGPILHENVRFFSNLKIYMRPLSFCERISPYYQIIMQLKMHNNF